MRGQENICYVVTRADLGFVLVAQSEKGVCAILINDSAKDLYEDLVSRFPEAFITEGDDNLKKLANNIAEFIDNSNTNLDIEMDLRGTDFQKRVWSVLRTIPAGMTISYAEVARRMNHPNAARAVAGACAANSLAVVVPCHRVVKSNGNVSGYRWGVDRKRKLLVMERERNCLL